MRSFLKRHFAGKPMASPNVSSQVEPDVQTTKRPRQMLHSRGLQLEIA